MNAPPNWSGPVATMSYGGGGQSTAPRVLADQLHRRSIGLHAANEFIVAAYPGHRTVRRHKFALALEDTDGVVRGVAITGTPIDRHLDTGWRLEVLQIATDDTPNVLAALYAAVAQAGVAIGFRRQDILTHTHTNDPGTALSAAGWVPVNATKNGPTSREQLVRWHAAAPTVGHVVRAA